VIGEEGLDASDLLKMTIYLADIDDFDEMNETYATFFAGDPPARSAIEVGNVPKGAALEIEAIASND
jgi:Putative translation initiation inhibitor, yjgF family